MGHPVIELDDVTKRYKIYKNPRHRAVEMLVPGVRRLHTDFWALRGITLTVERGETIGVVGVNGSGKSTLLQLLAGIIRPAGGRLEVHGRVSSLLELGAGFHPELTGRQNVEMFGTIIGLSLAEIRRRLPDIERFAGIGDFVEQPVKTYSSGMFVRLAFAAAIHVEPDILLVDEALAVGDAVFQHQCVRRIREMQAAGTTVIFVSHDAGMIKAVSSRVVLLDQGRLVAQGDPAEIASLYFARASAEIARVQAAGASVTIGSASGAQEIPGGSLEPQTQLFRHGTGDAMIRRVELLDAGGRPTTAVGFNEEAVLRVHAEYRTAAPASIIGFSLRDRTGAELIGTNTFEEGVTLPAREPNSALTVDFRLRLPLTPGTYSVSSAIAPDRYTRAYYDWVDNALVVTVLPPPSGKAIHGQVWVPVEISVRAS
ncbi:MAG TPA: ABC transporter ATP-binding protein [Vicinamibacterales bacterium]|nr:ABC transporter ATP-binding protein [Vicinamibacterales bacterium]